MSEQPTEPAEPTESESRPEARPGPKRGGKGAGLVAGLALLLAVFALGVSGWQWFQLEQQPDEGRLAGLDAGITDSQSRIDSLQQSLDDMGDRVGRVEGSLNETEGRLAALEDDLGAAQGRFEQVGARLDELESELLEQIHRLWQRDDTEREVDRELDRRLMLIEIAALLRLGQARAELAGDFSGARAAYRESASLLARADDPRLGSIRRLLAAELESLESVRPPDWLRAQARLERLSGEVGQWPLARSAQTIQDDQLDDPSDESGWRDSIRSALGQLVRVRPRDETPVSDEQLEIIRESLRMRLAAAELALGRRDMAELDHHLGRATATLNANFRTDDESVRQALDVLEELRRMEPEISPEGLGRALAALLEHLDGT